MQNRIRGKHMQGDIIIIFLFSVPISLCPSHYLFTLVLIEYRMVQVEYADCGERVSVLVRIDTERGLG